MAKISPSDFALASSNDSFGSTVATCFVSLGIQDSPLLLCAVEALRSSFTSQIAVKLSIDAIIETAFEVARNPRGEFPGATEIVRESIREANARVYEYGHRMGRGGVMGALAGVACYAENRLTMVRLGEFSGYVFRAGKLVSLFEARVKERAGELARYLGANAQVLVDLATLEAMSGDIFVFSSFEVPQEIFRDLEESLVHVVGLKEKAVVCLDKVLRRFPNADDRFGIVSLLQLGAPIIVLRNVVKE